MLQSRIATPLATAADPVRAPTAAASAPGDGPSFRDVLSMANPLQYLPVVGPIYRAITGDTVPESARLVGSFVVGALLGGPLGLFLNGMTMAAEKATGLDPDTMAGDVVASVGLGSHGAATPAEPAAQAPAEAANTPWSPAQLAAYGATPRDGERSCDVLNGLELSRLARAA